MGWLWLRKYSGLSTNWKVGETIPLLLQWEVPLACAIVTQAAQVEKKLV